MSQQEIDSLYRALKPDQRAQQWYDVADPSLVKKARTGGTALSAPVSKDLVKLGGMVVAATVLKSLRVSWTFKRLCWSRWSQKDRR